MRPWRSLLFCVFGLFGGIPLIHFVASVGITEALEYGCMLPMMRVLIG
jgi:hypothetical protein